MTFLNVTIAVFLLVAAAVLILLLSPLWLRIRYEDSITVYAGIGPVRIKLYPSKEKKKAKKKAKKKNRRSKKKQPVKQSHVQTRSCAQEKQTAGKAAHNTARKTSDDKMSVKEILELVMEILTQVWELFQKRAKIEINRLVVVVSKPDAADTAIQFGLCSGIVSSILAFTSNFGKAVIKDENVRIEPDFITGKSRVETDIKLSARVCHVAAMLLKMLYDKSFKK